jgi:CheY-like chemotaxis protein
MTSQQRELILNPPNQLMKKFSKVLLIEDDAVTQYVIEELLRSTNFATTIYKAKDGEEGIFELGKLTRYKKATRQKNLILLDLKMPGVDGMEFMKRFYSDPELAKYWSVYVLTSSSDHHDIEKAINYPIKGYMVKPLTEEKLNNVISEYFE